MLTQTMIMESTGRNAPGLIYWRPFLMIIPSNQTLQTETPWTGLLEYEKNIKSYKHRYLVRIP